MQDVMNAKLFGCSLDFSKLVFSVFQLLLFALPSVAVGQGEYSFYRHDTDTWYIVDTSDYSFTTWNGYAYTLYGGDLASITSKQELQWIQYNVRASTGATLDSEVWIGLNDSSSEGTYVWTDGQGYSYSNWASGEPNDGGGGGSEDYTIYRFFSSGEWNDYTNTPSFGALIKCPSFAPNGSVCDSLNDGTDPVCIAGNIFLENGDIDADQTFKHEGTIVAGNNVDSSSSPNGDLDISGGTTVLWSEDHVRLSTGFSVSSGGILQVKVSGTQCS